MIVIIRKSLSNILKFKKFLYAFFMGVFFLIPAYNLHITVRIGAKDRFSDVSNYLPILLLQFFLFLFWAYILLIMNNDIEEEIKDGTTELTLTYISRWEYFTGKIVGYIIACVVFFLFYYVLTIILLISGLIDLQKNFGGVVWGYIIILVNAIFLIILFFLVRFYITEKAADFISLFIYLLVFISSKKEFLLKFRFPEKFALFISTIFPPVFSLQNKSITYMTGFKVSLEVKELLIMLFYILFLCFICYKKSDAYECNK